MPYFYAYKYFIMKKTIAIFVTILLSGCAGIAFCDKDGQPKGCRKWDPATITGASSR